MSCWVANGLVMEMATFPAVGRWWYSSASSCSMPPSCRAAALSTSPLRLHTLFTSLRHVGGRRLTRGASDEPTCVGGCAGWTGGGDRPGRGGGDGLPRRPGPGPGRGAAERRGRAGGGLPPLGAAVRLPLPPVLAAGARDR